MTIKNKTQEIEILAPGGDLDSIKAAILAGANAIFCGLNKFNARNRAHNISIDDLDGILYMAHQHNCKIFLTLNILLTEEEIPHLFKMLNRIVNTSIDGIILQDLGLFYIVNKYFPTLKIHASTQLTTHNGLQIDFLKQINAERINLSRELNIDEIKQLSETAHKQHIDIEVFVHGSFCVSYSGQCYLSSYTNGNSGNRGRCSQPCRDAYKKTDAGHTFPLNLKDNSSIDDLEGLINAGADSLKIEGRIKKYHYVYAAVQTYKNQVTLLQNSMNSAADVTMLHTVFHRSFTQGFMKNQVGKEMFIDYPRDYSSIHHAQLEGDTSYENLKRVDQLLYDRKTDLRTEIEQKMEILSAKKQPMIFDFETDADDYLLIHFRTPDHQCTYKSEIKLQQKGKIKLTKTLVEKRFNPLNISEYFIQEINLDQLHQNRYIPLQELTAIRNKIHKLILNGRAIHEEIKTPKRTINSETIVQTQPSILIHEAKDIKMCHSLNADIYFEIPNEFSEQIDKLSKLFHDNNTLIPWFQAIVPENQIKNIEGFLRTIKVQKIVSNNSGIIYLAKKMGLECIAGPHLNITNSFALKALKETYGCKGAFLSNELSKKQLNRITAPEDFTLHFSIFHPITLMTSKACLFQTTSGCHKSTMDEQCIKACMKSTSIVAESGEILRIEKRKGNFNTIESEAQLMNLDIVNDFRGKFSYHMIDLRFKSENIDQKKEIVQNLLNYIKSLDVTSKECLQNIGIKLWNKSYQKGI